MPVTPGAAPSGSFNNFGLIAAQQRVLVGQVVRLAAEHINERIQASYRTPKTGRMYGRHQASAPGESPAINFGTLASSWRVVPLDDFHASVATTDEKAPYLEFGTRFLAARPHAGPAAKAELPDFEKAVASALGRGSKP